jgi:hypothetical protein
MVAMGQWSKLTQWAQWASGPRPNGPNGPNRSNGINWPTRMNPNVLIVQFSRLLAWSGVVEGRSVIGVIPKNHRDSVVPTPCIIRSQNVFFAKVVFRQMKPGSKISNSGRKPADPLYQFPDWLFLNYGGFPNYCGFLQSLLFSQSLWLSQSLCFL